MKKIIVLIPVLIVVVLSGFFVSKTYLIKQKLPEPTPEPKLYEGIDVFKLKKAENLKHKFVFFYEYGTYNEYETEGDYLYTGYLQNEEETEFFIIVIPAKDLTEAENTAIKSQLVREKSYTREYFNFQEFDALKLKTHDSDNPDQILLINKMNSTIILKGRKNFNVHLDNFRLVD